MAEQAAFAPERVFVRLWQKIPGHAKWTFAAAFILGLVTHLYVFTNDLLNHDDIYHLLQCDYGVLSGRWFLPAVLQWDSTFSMPWLIGVLSLFCLSVTVAVTAVLFDVRGRLTGVLMAAVMVAYPTVAATFTYMFTADSYFFAMMLAALAALAVDRMPWLGMPLGILCLVLSLGIYQSYFPVAAVLMVGALIFAGLTKSASFFSLIGRGVRMVIVLGVSVGLYMVLARWFGARAGGLNEYMGISEMGHLTLSEIPSLVVKCYREYWNYYIHTDLGYFFDFVKPLLLFSALATIVLAFMLLVERGVGAARAVLVVILLALYPLAGDLIHLMVAGGDVHTLMIYASVFVLVLAVAMVSQAGVQFAETGGAKNVVSSVLSWIIILSMALAAYSNIVADNKAYVKMEVAKSQITAYSNRLISAIENTEGYTPGMPVVLVGSSVSDPLLQTTPELNEIWMVGLLDASQLRAKYSFGEFLQYYMAFPCDVYQPNSADEAKAEVAQQIGLWPEVEAMPNYPAQGSIQLMEGYMVVKLATPLPVGD